MPHPGPASRRRPPAGNLTQGAEVIRGYLRTLPNSPGVYRMMNADGDVLYVGKAKNLKKRVVNYTQVMKLPTRLQRMVAETTTMEFVTTHTEVEALLLESNLIKRLMPRYNVLLRDDKSFPYIKITRDHDYPQLTKHRGARDKTADYFGPFASGSAVNRTVTALQRAFQLRNCADTVYATRTRPCLQHQIKRCTAPCVGRVTPEEYQAQVAQARAFLSGKSRDIQAEMAKQMQAAAEALDFETAARYRDRIRALTATQAHQDINVEGIDDADVIACHQDGGSTCIQVFFFRGGSNYGNRAYFPSHDKNLELPEVLGAFISQFYDNKPSPKLILVSHEPAEQDLIAEALSLRAGHKVELVEPKRGDKKRLLDHALVNAKEALGRRLSESASQARLLEGVAEVFGLDSTPERIEVYDNSHIQGTNAIGAMIVAGPDGLMKNSYRKFNIRSDIAPGDDYGMMREVLTRRFSRAIKEDPDRERGTVARPRADRRRPGTAFGSHGSHERAGHHQPGGGVDRQGTGPERGAGTLLHARPPAFRYGPEGPRPVFPSASARRGPPLRHRDPQGAAHQGDRAIGDRRDPRHRPEPQEGAAPPFRFRSRRRTGRVGGSGGSRRD